MFSFDSSAVRFDSSFWRFSGTPRPSSPFCGDVDAITAQAIALLPRGRAWQTDDAGPRPGSVLYGYWRSVASVFDEVNVRLCDLKREFFCVSHVETRDEWLAEYGLPDECDPFPNLCAKVAGVGGASCDVYRAIAADAGWDIDCFEDQGDCGAIADCFQADAENAVAASSPVPARVTIRVYRETSPAYSGPLRGGAYADCLIADGLLDCPPDISGLICILNRVIHAHVVVDYVISEPRTTLTDASLTADSGINITGEA